MNDHFRRSHENGYKCEAKREIQDFMLTRYVTILSCRTE